VHAEEGEDEHKNHATHSCVHFKFVHEALIGAVVVQDAHDLEETEDAEETVKTREAG